MARITLLAVGVAAALGSVNASSDELDRHGRSACPVAWVDTVSSRCCDDGTCWGSNGIPASNDGRCSSGGCTVCEPGYYLNNGKCKQCRSGCDTGKFLDNTCDGTGTSDPRCVDCDEECPSAAFGWTTSCENPTQATGMSPAKVERYFDDACIPPQPCPDSDADSEDCGILLTGIDEPCTLSTIRQACPAACDACTAAPTSAPTASPTTSSPTPSPTTSSPTVAPTASPTVTPVVCVQPGGGSGFGQDTANGVKKGGRFVRSISSDSNASASPAIVVGSTIFGVVVGAVATIIFRSVRRETVADRV